MPDLLRIPSSGELLQRWAKESLVREPPEPTRRREIILRLGTKHGPIRLPHGHFQHDKEMVPLIEEGLISEDATEVSLGAYQGPRIAYYLTKKGWDLYERLKPRDYRAEALF